MLETLHNIILNKDSNTVEEIWEQDVFNDAELKQRLIPSSYNKFKSILIDGGVLDADLADQVSWSFAMML